MNSILSIFDSFDLSQTDIAVFMLSALMVGMAKAGVKGLGTVSIPLTVMIFGAKASTGIILPVLIYADTFTVLYYYKKTDWSEVKSLIPFSIIGVIIAVVVGMYISDRAFQYLMGVLILVCLVLLIMKDRAKSDIDIERIPLVKPSTGLSLGFSTMIGNAAGPFLNIYLLLKKMPKEIFIATSAVYFYIINFVKIPFHIWVWHTISWDTFLLSLTSIPAILIGVIIGILLVKIMSDQFFKWLVIISTAVSGIVLLI